MTTGRLTHLATFATVTAVSAFALTACGTSTDSVTPATEAAASTAADPREVLLNAVPGVDASPYTFKVKGSETPISGVVDGPAKAYEVNMAEEIKEAGTTLKLGFLVLGQKGWVRIAFSPNVAGLPKLPKKWMLLDQAKLTDKSIFDEGQQLDPGYVGLLVENAAGLKVTSAGHFTGTTDLTKADAAEIVDAAGLKAMGAAATKAPFTAVVDGGHLTSLVVKIPAAGKTKAHDYTVSYSGYDSTPKVAEPAAGDQQKATAAAYEFLNG
ncbi:hypothetical protein BJ973_005984 [Actinoplanes tereljensis]|uniref:Lipoprotein n=1 Tax=Paractinoplanes tereljensis TaxID=571912 RepID=A0A919TSC7_9ACTN|nr:hypothetical protein [Actinoplanes tereljensis]GIF18937.1 hypothetical protein Ate02nite_16670 [Actinoplanes tereljensis]